MTRSYFLFIISNHILFYKYLQRNCYVKQSSESFLIFCNK